MTFGNYNNTSENANGWDSSYKPKPNKVVQHYHYHYYMTYPSYSNSHGYGCIPSHSGHYETTFQPPVSEPPFQPPVSETTFQPPVSETTFQPPVSEPPFQPPVLEPPNQENEEFSSFNTDDFLQPFSNGFGFPKDNSNPMSLENILEEQPSMTKLELTDLEQLIKEEDEVLFKNSSNKLVGKQLTHKDGSFGQIVDFYTLSGEELVVVNWSNGSCKEYTYPNEELSLLSQDEELSLLSQDEELSLLSQDEEEKDDDETWEDIPVKTPSPRSENISTPKWKEGHEIQFLWNGHWYLGEIMSSTIDEDGDVYYNIYYWIRNSEKWVEHTDKSVPEYSIRSKEGKYLKGTKVDVLYSKGGEKMMGWYPAVIAKDETDEDPHPDIIYDKSFWFEYGIDPRKVRFYA